MDATSNGAVPTRPIANEGIRNIRQHMELATPGWPPATVFLNSNENAFGPSPYAVEAARAASYRLERYVENQNQWLAPTIAAHHRLDARRIAIGCGSDDVLARLARCYLGPGTELLRVANSYPKSPNYAHACNAKPVSAPSDGFRANVDSILRSVTERTRIVYLANPDNPSNTMISLSEIRRLQDGLPAHVLLILDGAYLEYTSDLNIDKLVRIVEENQNVVLTRTLSKIHGLAAARVGWMYGPCEIAMNVAKLQLTFPIAVSSIHAAMAALDDREHTRFVREETARLRSRWSMRLAQLGVVVEPGQTNFLLLDFRQFVDDSTSILRQLRARGILVRHFAGGAYSSCLRVTLGRHAEMEQFGSVLAEILEGLE